jgi:hypothetical protein
MDAGLSIPKIEGVACNDLIAGALPGARNVHEFARAKSIASAVPRQGQTSIRH